MLILKCDKCYFTEPISEDDFTEILRNYFQTSYDWHYINGEMICQECYDNFSKWLKKQEKYNYE